MAQSKGSGSGPKGAKSKSAAGQEPAAAGKGSPSNRTARARAAQARAEQQAAEKRRQRIINITAAVVIVAVFGAIVGGAWLTSRDEVQNNGLTADPAAAAPQTTFPTGDPNEYGVPLAGDKGPVLAIWEDFQCPGCGAFEAAVGSDLVKQAEAGKFQLVMRPTTFLDVKGSVDHSRRATAAFGCAVDAGKGTQYKKTVYANQPEQEYDGWTDEQLLSFGEQAGIEGEAYSTFEKCFTDRVYLGWAANSTDAFNRSSVGGTPTAILNGTEIAVQDLGDPKKLQAALDKANAEAEQK